MHEIIQKLIPILKGEFLTNVPLRNYTTFHIGGPAEILIFPYDTEDLKRVIILLNDNNLKFKVIGNGSNLLVMDEGFHGIFICLKKHFNSMSINEENMEVEAGVMLPLLAKKAFEEELSGLEFAVGIPGTIGGAVYNNAGAFGQSMGNIVSEIEIVKIDGEIKKISASELVFLYRKCKIPVSGIITKIKLALKREPSSSILKKMRENVESRNKTQPADFASAGSIFKNPEGDSAGRIIEHLGLKGKTCGNAQISQKHANFIINTGGARANDVLELIELIKKTVYEKMGIKLDMEIEIIGNGKI
ncbi:UDP-N-acetylmuramate dehydrogenase [Candidatus Desantisbacteria bacterium]|nr:UDP-N-acetylmuramate dehydrogenase [Candidatus Desantisbacteria bacterium]